eukprot:gene5506-9323_t
MKSNYYNTDCPPRGEILIRTYYPFVGYYKEPEITKETLTEDGFVHTGDIGNGEYIAPEKIENIMIQSPLIQAIWVTGNCLHNYIVAFVVPAPEAIHKYAKGKNKKEDLATLCKDEDVFKLIMDDMKLFADKLGLNKLETPKKIYFGPTIQREMK